MRQWWGLNIDSARFGAANRDASLINGEFPAHLLGPALLWRWNDAYTEQTLAPAAYTGNWQWGAGAGAWTMSAKTLARILHGMGPSDRAPQLISPAQLQLLGERIYNRGRGWQATTFTESYNSFHPQTQAPQTVNVEWTALEHNGSTFGGSSQSYFLFRGSQDAPSTISVSLLANHSNAEGFLRTAARQLLRVGFGLSNSPPGLEGDLFDPP